MLKNGDVYSIKGNITGTSSAEVNICANDFHLVMVEDPTVTGSHPEFMAVGTSNPKAFALQSKDLSTYMQPQDAGGVEVAKVESPNCDLTFEEVSGETDVYQIRKDFNGEPLYLTLLDTNPGSAVLFASHNAVESSKQKWKFTKASTPAPAPDNPEPEPYGRRDP